MEKSQPAPVKVSSFLEGKIEQRSIPTVIVAQNDEKRSNEFVGHDE